MTPYEAVTEQYAFPFELRQYQITEVNAACQFERYALYWEPGSGKTTGATHWMLFNLLNAGYTQWVCKMPPILLEQWKQFLTSIRSKKTGEPLSVLVYDGSPEARRKMALTNQFILTSNGLFKNDYERIYTWFQGKRVGVLDDEAHSIKNIGSQTHEATKDFADGRPWMPLTGTPITKPIDGYAYVRMLTGNKIYRNLRAFHKLHVEEFDSYDRPSAYKNLDLLAANMKVQSSRILRREVQKELPPVIHAVMPYLLADAHLELYNRYAQERLLEYEGLEISALTASKLRSDMQQLVVNWPYFGQDDSLRPAILDLIDETMEEVGYRKVTVVANFRRSNAYLLDQLRPYGAVGIWGDVSKSQRAQALTRFLHDDSCRVILLHPDSAGFGLDGLQHVCSEMLIVEAPSTANKYYQVLARLDRDGQLEPVRCRIAVAQRTVQVRLFKNLLANDEQVNEIQGGFQDLKDSIYGA